MKDFTIGSLSIIANFQPSGGILLQTPIQGIDSPNYRNNSFSNPGRHGVTVSSQFYDGRILNLVGEIHAGNPVDFYALRKQLSQAVQIQKDPISGYPLPIRVNFTTLDGLQYFMDVKFDKPVFDIGTPNFSEFQITGTVENPFIFGITPISTGNISPPMAGGRTTPTVTPYTTTSSSGGLAGNTNTGDETAYPIINLYGSLTNPVITNVTTGQSIQLNYTVNAGDIVTIDMYNQTIVLNSSSSLISAKSIASSWWGIQPGLNNISLSTGSSSDTGYINGTYYPPFVGV